MPEANKPKKYSTKALVKQALAEDLGTRLNLKMDFSSRLLGKNTLAKATICSREPGILAGREPSNLAFRLVDKKTDLNWLAADGQELQADQTICEISGSLASICSAERTALNFLSHLSGIATLTRKFVEAAGKKAAIYDTRKTIPGLRALEKAAVKAGGGNNHRFSLSDAIMLKDNHLTSVQIEKAIQTARQKHPKLEIEVECETQEQLEAALLANADSVLLDNMDENQLKQAVELVGSRCITEASGGITLETVKKIAGTGVDRISIGAITKSAPALDFSLEAVTPNNQSQEI